jgi:peptide/nickel transport system permease protein
MARFIGYRLLQFIPLALAISFVVFLFAHLSGDPVTLMVSPDTSPEDITRMRRQLGLEDPFLVQYARFIGKAVQGDLGLSIRHQMPASALIAERFPATLELAGASLLVAVIVGVASGIAAAIHRGTLLDLFIMAGATMGQAMPPFWLGLVLILTFGVGLNWLPVSGRGSLAQLILPALTLGSFLTAMNAQIIRSEFLEILAQDYLRTARAKGVPESFVILKHGLKNGLIPLVTLVALQMGQLLGGAVITETIFAWPGLGRLVVNAIYDRDYPLTQACVLVLALIFVLANLFADIAYAYIDPRIRYER